MDEKTFQITSALKVVQEIKEAAQKLKTDMHNANRRIYFLESVMTSEQIEEADAKMRDFYRGVD